MDIFNLKGKNYTYLIYRFVYQPVRSNMYVIINKKEAIIIDPHKSEDLVQLLLDKEVTHLNILLTHEHFDHTSGLKWIMGLFPSTLYCQKSCADAVSNIRLNNPALVALVLASEEKRMVVQDMKTS